MQTPPIDSRALAQAGVEALRRGDARGARQSFERIIAANQADASVYLGLSYACSGLKDQPAALAAVDKALALEPQNLRALIIKADHMAALGDARAACAFYGAAADAVPPANHLPADLRDEVARARAQRERYATEFGAFLRDRWARQGLVEPRASSRFTDSIDILAGMKKIYFQEPRHYFFPGLPQIQFYDRNDFPWLDKVEAATADIRAELIAVLKDESAFKPYVESQPGRPDKEQAGMLNNPDWSAFYLWKHGEVVPQNAARCPKTVSAMAGVPMGRVKNRSPSVLFSLLRPGARIPPHTGEVNTRLICHLPLIVPGDCGFRVGNDTRALVEGKAWVFDDTIEHEAWNRSDQTRVILLFEIWRPELTKDERRLVSAMFEAIDAYGGGMPAARENTIVL
ncbi:MAG: aspartyl/asparaginyl beta-hydroxylase domain-containing protein [Betaproteobacteria bacterium]|nr:aspartyl/asparaginyl beta-hydroxylase domain-containing protein [Betaproteobacteria bacterium]